MPTIADERALDLPTFIALLRRLLPDIAMAFRCEGIAGFYFDRLPFAVAAGCFHLVVFRIVAVDEEPTGSGAAGTKASLVEHDGAFPADDHEIVAEADEMVGAAFGGDNVRGVVDEPARRLHSFPQALPVAVNIAQLCARSGRRCPDGVRGRMPSNCVHAGPEEWRRNPIQESRSRPFNGECVWAQVDLR